MGPSPPLRSCHENDGLGLEVAPTLKRNALIPTMTALDPKGDHQLEATTPTTTGPSPARQPHLKDNGLASNETAGPPRAQRPHHKDDGPASKMIAPPEYDSPPVEYDSPHVEYNVLVIRTMAPAQTRRRLLKDGGPQYLCQCTFRIVIYLIFNIHIFTQ
jgi:hypothetical protein